MLAVVFAADEHFDQIVELEVVPGAAAAAVLDRRLRAELLHALGTVQKQPVGHNREAAGQIVGHPELSRCRKFEPAVVALAVVLDSCRLGKAPHRSAPVHAYYFVPPGAALLAVDGSPVGSEEHSAAHSLKLDDRDLRVRSLRRNRDAHGTDPGGHRLLLVSAPCDDHSHGARDLQVASTIATAVFAGSGELRMAVSGKPGAALAGPGMQHYLVLGVRIEHAETVELAKLVAQLLGYRAIDDQRVHAAAAAAAKDVQ